MSLGPAGKSSSVGGPSASSRSLNSGSLKTNTPTSSTATPSVTKPAAENPLQKDQFDAKALSTPQDVQKNLQQRETSLPGRGLATPGLSNSPDAAAPADTDPAVEQLDAGRKSGGTPTVQGAENDVPAGNPAEPPAEVYAGRKTGSTPTVQSAENDVEQPQLPWERDQPPTAIG